MQLLALYTKYKWHVVVSTIASTILVGVGALPFLKMDEWIDGWTSALSFAIVK